MLHAQFFHYSQLATWKRKLSSLKTQGGPFKLSRNSADSRGFLASQATCHVHILSQNISTFCRGFLCLSPRFPFTVLSVMYLDECSQSIFCKNPIPNIQVRWDSISACIIRTCEPLSSCRRTGPLQDGGFPSHFTRRYVWF